MNYDHSAPASAGAYPRPGPGSGRPRPPPHHPGQYHDSQEVTPAAAAYMTDSMAAMNLNGHNVSTPETHAYQGNYGHAVGSQHRAAAPRDQPQAYQASRGYGAPMNPRPHPPFQENSGMRDNGYRDYEAPTYDPLPVANRFAAPTRAVTMPIETPGHQTAPSHARAEALPYSASAGRVVPQRPATTTGTRPPPQRTYPQDRCQSSIVPYGSERGVGPSNSQISLTDVFDDYYDSPHSEPQPQQVPRRASHDMAASGQSGRSSFDPTMPYQEEQPHRGAHHVPHLSHAKSMAEMREPQSAVFEMAGDIPSVPPIPPYSGGHGQGDYNKVQGQTFDGSHDQNQAHVYGQAISCDQVPPRGPSAPPAPGHGPYRWSGTEVPPMPQVFQRVSSDFTSHPTPVRPGQMPNSLVNRSDRPPPVRNYGGVAMPQQQYAQNAYTQQERQYAPPPIPSTASLNKAQEKQSDSPVTTQELEQKRMVIKANPADQQTALQLARRLIEAADVLAPKLADPRARGKARERYMMDAHKILKKLAGHRNVEAMFTLADGLGKGIFGGEPDTKEAYNLYHSAARMGHAAAAYRTAVCCEIGYDEGGGTRRDPQKAIQWYKRAAAMGDPPGMYKLGMIMLKGLLGQHKNLREAVRWLQRAAEKADTDNPHALHELGLLYESAQPNDVIVRDEEYARRLFQQAADLGYKYSQFRLGCAYEHGVLGCYVSARQSIVWYSRAAMQEEHQSELALSGWYLTGSKGVLEQNDTEAYLWARKAAMAGLAKAEFAMGYFTEVGIGIAPNLEDAKRWYWRAAAQDFPKARERLEELKRTSRNLPRPRERFSRSHAQEADCIVM